MSLLKVLMVTGLISLSGQVLGQPLDSIVVEHRSVKELAGPLNLDLSAGIGYYPVLSIGMRAYWGHFKGMVFEAVFGTNYPTNSPLAFTAKDIISIKFDTTRDIGSLLSFISALELPENHFPYEYSSSSILLNYGYQFLLGGGPILLVRGGGGVNFRTSRSYFGSDAHTVIHPAVNLEASIIFKLLGESFK